MRSLLGQICALVIGGVVLGSVLNSLRPNPLPWRYVKLTNGSGEHSVAGLIGLEELRKLSAAEVLIVDARPPLFFKRSHIPGAINIAKQYLPRDFSIAEPLLRNAGGRRLVIYCSHDECEDSQKVADELCKMGFGRVFVFKDGWKGWQKAGLPEEKG